MRERREAPHPIHPISEREPSLLLWERRKANHPFYARREVAENKAPPSLKERKGGTETERGKAPNFSLKERRGGTLPLHPISVREPSLLFLRERGKANHPFSARREVEKQRGGRRPIFL